MPKKALPAEIERNDTEPSTQAQKDAIEAIKAHYDSVDHLTEIADQTKYSRSHVNSCYRQFFDSASELSKTEAKKRSSPNLDTNETYMQTPEGTVRIDVPDEQKRKELLSFASEVLA